jgi:hypothetical protein
MRLDIDKYVFIKPVVVPWIKEPLKLIDMKKHPPKTAVNVHPNFGLLLIEEGGERFALVPDSNCIKYGLVGQVDAPLLINQPH